MTLYFFLATKLLEIFQKLQGSPNIFHNNGAIKQNTEFLNVWEEYHKIKTTKEDLNLTLILETIHCFKDILCYCVVR